MFLFRHLLGIGGIHPGISPDDGGAVSRSSRCILLHDDGSGGT
jgi:hypothetical protein